MDKTGPAPTEDAGDRRSSEVYDLTPVTIEDLSAWRVSSSSFSYDGFMLEKIVYYNFQEFVVDIADALSFLQDHIDGAVAMGPAKLLYNVPKWMIVQVLFETVEKKQEALRHSLLEYANGQFVECASPIPSNRRYSLMRFKDLPLEPPKDAVARVRESVPTFFEYWKQEQSARPQVIDVVVEGHEKLKTTYSGNISVIIQGGWFSRNILKKKTADIEGYGLHDFELLETSFHEYCQFCRMLNGGHETRSCPRVSSNQNDKAAQTDAEDADSTKNGNATFDDKLTVNLRLWST